tara:strand:+ start:708 stop:1424 length:717 start_codon:yes stop_codon:yes gene_type:complete
MSKRKKSRRRKNKNHYFTSVHEDAIVRYARINCPEERTKLYINFIQPAFNEMVDKITYTYRFTTLPNIDSLREECKIWLTTILDKYDPNKGSKAFSYFSVITKNWFIHEVKKTSQKAKREISLDVVTKQVEKLNVSSEHKYIKEREKQEFWQILLKEIDEWQLEKGNEKALSPNDTKVIKAIKELLSAPEEIEILSKKAIYLYMRELTNLNTKQIATSLKRFKIKYYKFKKDWNSGEI